MPNATQTNLGSVVSLWRYPVKSMMGEELNATDVTHRGLLGDRAYALVDSSNEKVASAKNPRKWAKLFDFRAALAEPVRIGEKIPPVHVALPDGTMVTSEQSDTDQILSSVLGREVTLQTREPAQEEVVETTLPNPWTRSYEEYWPDMEDLTYRDTITHEAMPEGTFFDLAVIHILTTATIDRLRELYPQGRFEARRFRPNIVVEPSAGAEGFVEDEWLGKTLVIGDEVRIDITEPCPRCVMTTLAQGDLPKDPGILRTAAQHNQVNVGVYGAVVQGGTIRRGDPVRVE
jgi:MOSC domain-containing protein